MQSFHRTVKENTFKINSSQARYFARVLLKMRARKITTEFWQLTERTFDLWQRVST